MTQEIQNIIQAIGEVQEDNTVPKNIKEKTQGIIEVLRNHSLEISIKVDKALQMLDEIAEDSNLQPYTRTQIWNIASMLEKL